MIFVNVIGQASCHVHKFPTYQVFVKDLAKSTSPQACAMYGLHVRRLDDKLICIYIYIFTHQVNDNLFVQSSSHT